MKTGTANLPLHYGKAPAWLFGQMKLLAREIVLFISSELGPQEILKKLADPFWFQSFGCVLGFDWHSSGLTTTVCGALKEGLKGLGPDTGLFVAGGKGKTSRKTPQEIESSCLKLGISPKKLIYASKMSAKVDSAAVQDGYQLYHHSFFFTAKGNWSVVQQGMNEINHYARRYHWLSDKVEEFVNEPHSAICTQQKSKLTLDLTSKNSSQTRNVTPELASDSPKKLVKELRHLKELTLTSRHQVLLEDINPTNLKKIFLKTYTKQPKDFPELLYLQGVGPKSIRALSLISELVYGTEVSYQDPARFSFAHGGKDGHPYPVNRQVYDASIELLHKAVQKAKIDKSEKIKAIKRLGLY